MRKRNLFLLFAFLFFITVLHSCNGNHEENKIQTKNINTVENELSAKESTLIKSINTYPDSLLCKENLIQFYRANNQYDKAIKSVNQFILDDSLNIRFIHIKGVLLMENSDTIEAVKCFEKCLSIYPLSLDLINLGAIYANQQNIKSISIADKLLNEFKDEAEKEAYFIKGSYYSNIGNKKMAITYFDSCINHTITFMEAYREKALALAEERKYKEAISTLKKAVTLNNNYPEGYFYLGKIYEKTKDISNAVEAYQTALLYDPSYKEAAEAIKRLNHQ